MSEVRGLASACGVATMLAFLALAGWSPSSGQPSSASAAKGAPPPARLLVTAREFGLTLSRPKLVAGSAIVQLYNFGEDPHDLRLRRVGATRDSGVDEVEPGETGELQTRLRRASRYRLWCSLSGHAELGMTATVRTTKKTARQRATAKKRKQKQKRG